MLLKLPDELVEIASDLRQLVVGDLAPLSLDLTLELLPLTFQGVCVHVSPPGQKAPSGSNVSLQD
jgi:hypothetical protein